MTEERIAQLYDEYIDAQSEQPPDVVHMKQVGQLIHRAEQALPPAA